MKTRFVRSPEPNEEHAGNGEVCSQYSIKRTPGKALLLAGKENVILPFIQRENCLPPGILPPAPGGAERVAQH